MTISANLIPTTRHPNQKFKVYVVVARQNSFIKSRRAAHLGNVVASSTTITSHGAHVRKITVTVPAGLEAGTYYVVGVLNWFQTFPNGQHGVGQIQPLLGLLRVSTH